MNAGIDRKGITVAVGRKVVDITPKMIALTVNMQRKFLRNFLKVPFADVLMALKIFFD
jgi:hypothetical protein